MAYTTAKIVRNEPGPDGRPHIWVQFIGDAGEPSIIRDRDVEGASALSLRQWAIGIASALDGQRSLATLPALQLGATFNLTPIAPTPPTAKQVWFSDLARLKNLRAAIDLGAAPGTADDALVADLLTRFGTLGLTDADF